MIAVPIDDRQSTTISFEYTKAPFFALLDTMSGFCRVIENTKKDSLVVELLHDEGVKTTVGYLIDDSICRLCEQYGVAVFEVQNPDLSLDEIYENAQLQIGLFA